MKTVIIDGRFLTKRITGVQRFACEMMRYLAEYDDLKLLVAAPKETPDSDELPANISLERFGKWKGRLWKRFSLAHYCRKHKAPLLCMENTAPIGYKNTLLVLHDVSFWERHPYRESMRIRAWQWTVRRMTRRFIYHTEVVTVSGFSRDRILHFFPKLKEEPLVVYNGWEHLLRIEEETVENLPSQFYLAVGSVNPNKNFRYVIELAAKNPGKQFIVTGSLNTDFRQMMSDRGIRNCRFTGYVSDGQLKYLYSHCTGFILPSFYEGFGIPPLEAIACGCRSVYLSDIPPFREVYGEVAVFFRPDDYANPVSLDDGHRMGEAEVQRLLDVCSWKRSAKILHDRLIRQN